MLHSALLTNTMAHSNHHMFTDEPPLIPKNDQLYAINMN